MPGPLGELMTRENIIFSLPGQSPGRAIVLSLALVLAAAAAAALAKC